MQGSKLGNIYKQIAAFFGQYYATLVWKHNNLNVRFKHITNSTSSTFIKHWPWDVQRPKLKNLPLLCQYATSAWKASHQYRPRTLIPRTTTEIEEKTQKSILKGWVGWVNFLAMIFYNINTQNFHQPHSTNRLTLVKIRLVWNPSHKSVCAL